MYSKGKGINSKREDMADVGDIHNGDGYGYGSGSGYGYGSDYGDGYGYGDGSGPGVSVFSGASIESIDGVQTIITRVKGNVARGHILQADLTLRPCYVAKVGDSFAHGDTAEFALRDATNKHLEDATAEERIERFVEQFPKGNRFSGSDLFDAHGWLTGSCQTGREQFVRDHNIDLTAMLSIQEFIALTQNVYGGEIVRRLEEHYK